MSAFIVALEAEEDIFQIWLYLLREAGLETATRIESEILGAFAGLSEAPQKGHRRSDLTRRKVLFFTLYQYLVVYRIGSPVEIVAVLPRKAQREADSQGTSIEQETNDSGDKFYGLRR